MTELKKLAILASAPRNSGRVATIALGSDTFKLSHFNQCKSVFNSDNSRTDGSTTDGPSTVIPYVPM